MSIEWLRDLTIVVAGAVFIVMSVLLCVLSCTLYSRTKDILDTVKVTAGIIQDTSSYVRSEAGKLVTAVTIIQGVSEGIQALRKIMQKGGANGK